MKLIKKLGTRLGKTGRRQSWGLYKCPDLYCGQEVERQLDAGKKAESCGCNRGQKQNKNNYKHGGTGTRLYTIWRDVLRRCLNQNYKQYKDYGGRGITICPEWTESYTEFRDWSLSNGYKEGLQINRIENGGNYEPNNCNFVTAKENCNNRRNPIRKRRNK